MFYGNNNNRLADVFRSYCFEHFYSGSSENCLLCGWCEQEKLIMCKALVKFTTLLDFNYFTIASHNEEITIYMFILYQWCCHMIISQKNCIKLMFQNKHICLSSCCLLKFPFLRLHV